LKSIGKVEKETITTKGTVKETRYYITSLTDEEKFAKSVRGHWSIENNLHWMLDAVLGEDKSRARKGNAPINLNIMRKFVLTLLGKLNTGRPRDSLRTKMYKIAMTPKKWLTELFKIA